MRVKSEKWIEGVKRKYFFGEVTVLNLRMLRERGREKSDSGLFDGSVCLKW